MDQILVKESELSLFALQGFLSADTNQQGFIILLSPKRKVIDQVCVQGTYKERTHTKRLKYTTKQGEHKY